MKGVNNMDDSINNMKYSSEPLPQILQEFCENVPGAQFDNLYLCESVDMDGNVVETKVGRNLMTNYGLSEVFVEHRSWTKYLYVGSGKSAQDPTRSSLESYISNLGYATYVSDSTTVYPSEFDPESKIFSVKYKMYQGYWNYTAGSNQEYEIWEIGYGTDVNGIYTRSLIYDKDGTQTCIHKRPNTRLYITIFWTVSLNVKCIEEAYDKKQYALIHPGVALYRQYGPTACIQPVARQNISSTNEMYISGVVRGSYYLTNTLDSSKRIAYAKGLMSSSSWTWEAPYMYLSGMMIGPSWEMGYQNSSCAVSEFSVLTYDELTEPEDIECEDIYVNSLSVINASAYDADSINSASLFSLTNTFGTQLSYYPFTSPDWSTPKGTLPVVQFNMQTLNMYDYKTKEWDIPVPFENAPDTYYNYAHWRMYLSLWTKYNGTNRWVYVYVNAYREYPITSFSNTSMTLCATDEYWNPDSYEQILNLTSVPERLGAKKYYIVVAGTNAILSPNYDATKRKTHKIVPDKKPFEITPDMVPRITSTYCGGQSGQCVGSQPISSDKYGYFLNDGYLVYLDPVTKECTYHKISMGEGDSETYMCFKRRYVTENEDRIVIFATYWSYRFGTTGNRLTNGYAAAKNKFKIFTVGDKNTIPTSAEMNLEFSTTVANNETYHHYSWSDKGYLVAQRREGVDEAVFVDIYKSEQHRISDCKHCYALNRTSYCVYQDMTATSDTKYTFRIYDMEKNEIFKTFVIDDGSEYTITGIYGWREFIYVIVTLNSITTTFFYNMKTEETQHTTISYTRFNTGYSWNNQYTESIDECMVSAANDNSVIKVYKADDPINPISLTSDNLATYYNQYDYRTRTHGKNLQIKRIKEGKQLLLSMVMGYHARVFDLGWILDNGPLPKLPYDFFPYLNNSYYNNDGSVYIFKDGVILHDGRTSYSDRVGRMYWVPIECFLRLKTTGTTKTITCYNNPMTFTGKGLSIGITNDMNLISNPDSVGG